MIRGKPLLLAMIPQPPPFGGVAFQASLLLQSRAFEDSFHVVRLRTNSVRLTENPDRKRIDIRSVSGATRLGASSLAAAAGIRYEAVYCVANGDISFPWVLQCALASSGLRGVPLVLHVHASRNGFWEWQKQHPADGGAGAGCFRRAMSGLGDRFCARLSRRVDRLIHLTPDIDAHYRSMGWRSADLTVPNSTTLPPSLDAGRKRSGSILFLGRISREKGFFDLLDALAALPPDLRWDLHVAGAVPAGEEHSEVESAIQSRALGNRVVLHGLVRGAEKATLLETCSMLVHPTHRDVFPMALVEAMSYGMAVVATGVGEIPSIPSPDGWAGVGVGDPSSLAAVLGGLLGDPASVARMGASNRDKAMSVYGVERNASRIAGSILDSLKERRR